MAATATGLPAGWEIRISRSKRTHYYFNADQRVSFWDPPLGSDTTKLLAYITENVPIDPVLPGAGTENAIANPENATANPENATANQENATTYAVQNVAAHAENSHVGIAENYPTVVEASHLLVKHRGSRNPKSWREKNITRTKEEARAILEGYRATIFNEENQKLINNGDDNKITLASLAKTESDCSSARAFGNLGAFTQKQMQAPFWDATVKLEVGQVSGIVETDSGLHLIQRTG